MGRLRGVMPVLVSPMHEDGSPDRAGYARLLDYLLDHQLAGLWVLGSGGENFHMSYAHRLDATRIVAEYAGRRTTLLVGCGDPVLSETYRLFDDTAHLPIDGYHLLPTDRKLSAGFTIDYCSMIADRAPKPLWLYSNPARALLFTPESVKPLAQHPNIAGMKVGGYELQNIIPLAMLNSGRFQVLGAGGGNHLVYLALGVRCCTMSTASSFPRQHVEVQTLWEQGRLDEAREKAFALNRLLRQFPPRQNTETSAEEKAVLELLGICRRWVYPPFKPLSDAAMAQLREVLAAHGILEAAGAPEVASVAGG